MIINYLIAIVFVNDALRTIQELYKAASSDVAGSLPIYVSLILLILRLILLAAGTDTDTKTDIACCLN